MILMLVFAANSVLAQDADSPAAENVNDALELMCPNTATDFTSRYAGSCEGAPKRECVIYRNYVGINSDYLRQLTEGVFVADFDTDCNFEINKLEREAIIGFELDLRNKDALAEVNRATTGSKFKKFLEATKNNPLSIDKPFDSEFFDVSDPERGLKVNEQQDNFSGRNPIFELITRFISLAITFLGLTALVMIVVGAYFMLTAAGEEESINKGKDIIKLALIGMVIAIFSFAIVSFVQSLIF